MSKPCCRFAWVLHVLADLSCATKEFWISKGSWLYILSMHSLHSQEANRHWHPLATASHILETCFCRARPWRLKFEIWNFKIIKYREASQASNFTSRMEGGTCVSFKQWPVRSIKGPCELCTRKAGANITKFTNCAKIQDLPFQSSHSLMFMWTSR